MSDAWDFGVAAGIQTMRAGVEYNIIVDLANYSDLLAGISYLKVDAPYVVEIVALSLAVLEGSILSNTLPDRRRLTLYPAVMLILRVLFDFISGASTMNAAIGMAGTLVGLLLGPIFHSPESRSNQTSPSNGLAKLPPRLGGGAGATHLAIGRRIVSPSRPVTLHTLDIDPATGEYSETSRQVLFTPAPSLRILDQGTSSDARSYTRVDESFSTDDTIRFFANPPAPETVYQDAGDAPGGKPISVKDHVRKLRAQAKNDDVNRRNLLSEREQVLQEGDVARAFLLKHQADSLKRSMQESDKEAAKRIFECGSCLSSPVVSLNCFVDYNPPERTDKTRVDLRGLQASEAVKFVDEALTDLQEIGGNVLTVSLGRSKNSDGSGKGKVKPTIRQYAQG